MAKLDKIRITGIRSFNPNDQEAQTIKFLSPVTLILGQNGSGKTTVIESLRYACTGEIPAGTNAGRGFLNDPKITSNSVVRGQIRLELINEKNEKILIQRVMEVLQKRTDVTFSTKSTSIRVVKTDGTDTSITGRCADINAQVAQMLNISPCVLNNVLLCHQENSSWPLEEAKKLKEKFDEIFEAQRYNQCADMLRKSLKERKANLKLLNIKVAYAKEKKALIDEKTQQLYQKEDSLKDLETDIKNKEQVLVPIKNRIQEIFDLEEILGDLQRKKSSKEETLSNLREQQQNLKRSIKFLFEGNDEELKLKIDSFNDDRQKDEILLNELTKRKIDIEERNKIIINAIEDVQTKIGKLNEEKRQYDNKREEQKLLIKQTKIELNSKCDLSENYSVIFKDFKEILNKSQSDFNDLLTSNENEEKDLQLKIDKNRESYLKIKHSLETKSKEITDCQKKIVDSQNEVRDIESSCKNLKTYESTLNNLDKTLNSLTETLKPHLVEKEITENQTKIQKSELNLENLEREYRILQENYIYEDKIISEKQTIIEKQKQINNLKSKHANNFEILFNGTVPESHLKQHVQEIHEQEQRTLRQLNNEINKKQTEVTTLEINQNNCMEKIRNFESDVKTKQDQFYEICLNKTLDETLQLVYEKKEQLQKDKGQYSSAKIIYETFLNDFAAEKPCCPVCQTSFTNQKSVVGNIMKAIRQKIESIPKKLSETETKLKQEEKMYDKLQQLKPMDAEVQRLKTEELPQLKKELAKVQETLKTEKEELFNFKLAIKDHELQIQTCNKVISDVALLDQYKLDVEKSENLVGNLESQIVSVDSNRSRQETEAQIDTVKGDLTNLRRNLDTLRDKLKKHNDRCNQIVKERSKIREKQLELENAVKNKPLLEQQMQVLNQKISDLKEEISDLNIDLTETQFTLTKSIQLKDETVKENKNTISERRNLLSKQSKLLDDIEKLQKLINVYLNSKSEEQLNETVLKMEELKNKNKSLEEARNKVIDAIASKRENLAKHEINLRSYQDNLSLRELKKKEVIVIEEVDELKAKILNYNYRTIYEEKQKLLAEKDGIETEINRMCGQQKEMSKTISEVRQELNRPENRDALKAYKSLFYQYKIAEKVISDLSKYIIAYEKAILAFHKSRMIEINRTIREYWRNIYTGNDIDYIEIKTEDSACNLTRRNYNYKVVQVKKGVELEMRGRCSAGQRVLACLIIRMALAETFSANCGILALDEPTTNLDSDNIESLSRTLSRIIDTRSQERNFQLLIITHDESFINELSRVQNIPYFYRMERNRDGFSTVKRENF